MIIYGTGFQASKFLTPMTVTGRDGVDLHEQWAGDARAYLGVTVPGFPNLFCLYGPNTNIVVNGSIVYFSECGVRYILGCSSCCSTAATRPSTCARTCTTSSTSASTPRTGAMAWGWSDVNSWYKNEHGHVAQNWPFTLLEYWQRTLPARPRRLRVRLTTTALQAAVYGLTWAYSVCGLSTRAGRGTAQPCPHTNAPDSTCDWDHDEHCNFATSDPARIPVPVAPRPMSGVTGWRCHRRDHFREV